MAKRPINQGLRVRIRRVTKVNLERKNLKIKLIKSLKGMIKRIEENKLRMPTTIKPGMRKTRVSAFLRDNFLWWMMGSKV